MGLSKKAREVLSPAQKRFVVMQLAVWESPIRIARQVKEQYGLEVSRQMVWEYDVSKRANEGNLSKMLTELFWETRKQFKDDIESLPLANKEARIRNKQERFDALDEIRLSRADDMEGDYRMPGGQTGLLCKDYKGKDADQLVLSVDLGLLTEMRALEESIAAELGQVVTRKDITSNGKSVGLFGELTDDELDARIAGA